MALKKKGVKKAEAAAGAGASSPKQSPKTSPKEAPAELLGAPKEVDEKLKARRNAKKKQLRAKQAEEKANGPSQPEVSAEDREAFKERAVALIKKGLKADPPEQKKGFPFIPKEWASEFKPVLGAYSRFVEKSEDFVLIQGDVPGRFTVQLADGTHEAKQKAEWEVKLRNTWQVYLQCTKKDSRNPKEFVELAMKLAGVEGDAGAPPAKKAEEAAAAAADQGGKKKRKKGAAAAEEAAAAEPEDTGAAQPPKKKKKAAA